MYSFNKASKCWSFYLRCLAFLSLKTFCFQAQALLYRLCLALDLGLGLVPCCTKQQTQVGVPETGNQISQAWTSQPGKLTCSSLYACHAHVWQGTVWKPGGRKCFLSWHRRVDCPTKLQNTSCSASGLDERCYHQKLYALACANINRVWRRFTWVFTGVSFRWCCLHTGFKCHPGGYMQRRASF